MRSSIFSGSVEELDVNYSADKFQSQRNKDVQYINLNKITLLTYIKDEIRRVLEECICGNKAMDEHSLVELLLISRFLGSAKLLAEPSLVQGLSKKEQLDIKLRCFTYRLLCYDLLNESGHFSNRYKEKILTVYSNEVERLVTFIQEADFNSYLLPDDLQRFIFRIGATKDGANIHVDDVINHLSSLFFKTMKRERKNPDVNVADKQDVKELKSRLVCFFHLQRFAVIDSIKLWSGLPLMDNFNIALPRLAASIIIGMIPVFFTDEINQWAYAEMQLFAAADWRSGLPKLLAPFLLLAFCWFYLNVEVRNILGYLDYKKATMLFVSGFFYSSVCSLFMHWLFTATFHLDPQNHFQPLFHLWGRPIFLELHFIQVSVSFFFGLVLQTIWEEKPISHPL